MRMTGNTVLVTGGTSGIGRGLAEALHDRGNRVIVTGRRHALLDAVTAARPGMVGFELDIEDPGAWAGLLPELARQYPDLNMLVANAGISASEDLAADDWDTAVAEALIATNIVGTLRSIAAFLPFLKRRRDGVVLATGSKLAFVPRADYPTYCASKAFLHGWLQGLRYQLRHVPVEILELLPPYVATELTGPDQATDPRAMPLEAFVTEVMALLEAGDHPHGEILVQRARSDRAAEREGRYDAAFAALNPA